MQEGGRPPVHQPEQREQVCRIDRRQVLDPAVERRVAHLDRHEQHLVEREEDRDLDQDRQAAGGGVDLLALVEGHHLLVELLPVVAEALAQLHHFRLQRLHLAHRAVGLVGQREEDQLDPDGERQDRQAEIAEHALEPGERVEERLGEEVEPAEIDGEVELREIEVVAVAVQQMGLLGAREYMVAHRDAPAGRHGDGGAQIVGLVFVDALLEPVQEARREGFARFRDEGRQPVFVGDAEPALRVLDLDLAVVGEVVIVMLLQPLAENPERAFMQDEETRGLRRAGARDEAVGIERHRRGGVVGDGLLDRQQEVVRKFDGPGEAQARAIVPGQLERPFPAQLPVIGGPERIAGRHRSRPVGRDPAELGVEGPARAGRGQQGDERTVGVGRLPVVLERDAVYARPGERDRAGDAAVFNRDAGRLLPGRGLPGGGLGSRNDAGRGGQSSGRGDGARLRAGRGRRTGRARLLRRRRHLGRRHHHLEHQQDADRDDDREEEVAVVEHGAEASVQRR